MVCQVIENNTPQHHMKLGSIYLPMSIFNLFMLLLQAPG